MATRTHVGSNRIPVRTKHRTRKVPRSPSTDPNSSASTDLNDGAGEDGALRREAGATDVGLDAREAGTDAGLVDGRDAATGAGLDDGRDAATDAGLDEGRDAETDAELDESGDTSRAAERLATGGEIDEELSEELGVDNIVGPLEAGLGGGLDQAEEALAGVTDEEIASRTRRR